MGVVPNAHFPNAFLATAHDLGDPWDDGCKTAPPFCCVDTGAPVDPACGPDRGWIVQTGKYPGTTDPVTPQLMGAIHPRLKKPVGDRLAQAAWALVYGSTQTAWTGPVVSGCTLAADGRSITVRFNSTLLSGDAVAVKGYNRTERASAMFVLAGGAQLPDDAYHNYLYTNRAPWWGDDASWVQVDIAAAPGSTDAVVVDTTALKGQRITAIRYGHGIPGTVPQNGHKRVCCGDRDVTRNPCPPASCPISSVAGKLPAMPFMARITAAGKCECMRPQVCDG